MSMLSLRCVAYTDVVGMCSWMPMQQVLRKYPDKTVARDLVRELESYNGDPSNLVMSGESDSKASAHRYAYGFWS